MVQAFEIIGVGHDKPAMQKLVLAIKADIETGNALNQALAKHPLYFDDLFVNLVEAGEHAGALETVLDKIATYKEKTEALKKKIKKALVLPSGGACGGGDRDRHPADLRDSRSSRACSRASEPTCPRSRSSWSTCHAGCRTMAGCC